MDDQIFERRRFLQVFALGSVALPAVALAGCATGSGPAPRRRLHGGGSSGEKSGNGGGPGAAGSKGGK